MRSFPTWIPKVVQDFYADLCDQRLPGTRYRMLYLNPAKFNSSIELLNAAISANQLKKAWAAIERRSKTASPIVYCELILDLAIHKKFIESVPSVELISCLKRLASDLDAALNRFYTASQYLDNLADIDLELTELKAMNSIAQGLAKYHEELRQDFASIAGKPGADSAIRTFLIRVTNQRLLELYDAPLYGVNAATVALLLHEDPLDTNHVMKLVKSMPTLPSTHYYS